MKPGLENSTTNFRPDERKNTSYRREAEDASRVRRQDRFARSAMFRSQSGISLAQLNSLAIRGVSRPSKTTRQSEHVILRPL